MNNISRKQDKFVSSTARVSIGTLVSRLFGLARDLIFAYLFGTSLASDAFNLAFRIPNIFRGLLGEGAFFAAFVPKYTGYITNPREKDRANPLASWVLIVLVGALAVITVLGVVFAEPIVSVFAYGWRSYPEKFSLTVGLTRLLFPYIFLVGIAVFFSGVLNSHKRFFVPAISPVMLNIFWIASMLIGFFLFRERGAVFLIQLTAIGVLAGGFFQFVIQAPFVKKVGFSLSFRKGMFRESLEVWRLLLPATVGFAAFQVNRLIDAFLASFLPEGSVSALQYGNRLVLFPLAMFGTAIATVSLPYMSESVAKGDTASLAHSLYRSLRLVILVLLPISLYTILLRYPIIQLIFERGQFTRAHSTPMTAIALGFYAVGLAAYGGVKVASQAFYSMKDTKTPVKIAVGAMLVNVVLNIILMFPLKHGGLALASSIASFFNLILLLSIFSRRNRSFRVWKLLGFGLQVLVLSLISLIPAYILLGVLKSAIGDVGILPNLALFVIPSVVGLSIYGFLIWILKLADSSFDRGKDRDY